MHIQQIQKLLISQDVLSNIESSKAAKEWLITSKNKIPSEVAAFDLLSIVSHLSLNSEVRLQLSEVVIEHIYKELGEKPNMPLLQWYLHEYKGDSLQDEIRTIIIIDSDYLANSFYSVYELLDDSNNKNKLMGDIISATGESDRKEGFDLFVKFIGKYGFPELEQQIFEYATGPDFGIILDELSNDIYRFETGETMSDLADRYNLNTLKFFSDPEKDSYDLFSCYEVTLDDNECIEGITSFLSKSNGQKNFSNLIEFVNNIYSNTSILEALSENGLEQYISLAKGLNSKHICQLSLAEQAKIFRALIESKQLLNMGEIIKQSYFRAYEAGSYNEMYKDLEKHSIFGLNESYTHDDNGHVVIEFDLASLLDDLRKEENLFSDYFPIENHGSMDEYFQELFEEKATSKLNDLDQPYYGWYGFCIETFSDELSNQLNNELEFNPPLAA